MPNSSDFNRFAVNPVNIDISRSLFNMDHSVKWSCNVGEVIPFDCMEVLPGDTFTVDTSKVIRLQPLVAPIMDEVILDTYWFFVPHRLVWNHWINFMGENTESAWAPQVEYTVPKIKAPSGGFQIGTIADYMGVPPVAPISGEEIEVSALPFRSYALICDQWFRSEALQDPVHVHVDDTTRTGVNTDDQVTDIELGGKPFIACKYFDYFTGALPSPQRGDAVSIQLATNRDRYKPVVTRDTSIWPHPYNVDNTGDSNNPPTSLVYKDPNNNEYKRYQSKRDLGIYNSNGRLSSSSVASSDTFSTDSIYFDNLFADLGQARLVTINELRTAFQMQKYLEKSARYGGRYIEMIKGFFNVDSPDARLQRSEYIGGSRLSLNINQVEQTSATEQNSTPLGNVAGMSVTADSNSDFTKSFTEHGFVIGCAVVRYHHSYQNGLNKMWLRSTKLDFYNPVFANLGEQAIDGAEIYAQLGTAGHSLYVFGYQERWAEYRYQPNRICSELRSNATTPLDMWHLADYYQSRPYLSASWIREDKTNLDRCLAVTSDVSNQVICDFYIKTEASRPMPLYSIPGLIDHH